MAAWLAGVEDIGGGVGGGVGGLLGMTIRVESTHRKKKLKDKAQQTLLCLLTAETLLLSQPVGLNG